MQVRSWMAALVIVSGTTGWQTSHVDAQTPKASPAPRAEKPPAQGAGSRKAVSESPESPDCHAVKLHLWIAGLGRDGCEVDIKPGNRSCVFRPQAAHIASDGTTKLLFRDVKLRGADRNCVFSITIREAGREARTVYRGFRVATHAADEPQAQAQAAHSFMCYVNSPSKLAGLEQPDRVRK